VKKVDRAALSRLEKRLEYMAMMKAARVIATGVAMVHGEQDRWRGKERS
jgi:hypothetical protein